MNFGSGLVGRARLGNFGTLGTHLKGDSAYRNPVPGAKCRCYQKTTTGHMAFCQASRQDFCVVVSTDGVKFIDEPSDWAKPGGSEYDEDQRQVAEKIKHQAIKRLGTY